MCYESKAGVHTIYRNNEGFLEIKGCTCASFRSIKFVSNWPHQLARFVARIQCDTGLQISFDFTILSHNLLERIIHQPNYFVSKFLYTHCQRFGVGNDQHGGFGLKLTGHRPSPERAPNNGNRLKRLSTLCGSGDGRMSLNLNQNIALTSISLPLGLWKAGR